MPQARIKQKRDWWYLVGPMGEVGGRFRTLQGALSAARRERWAVMPLTRYEASSGHVKRILMEVG